MGNTTGKRYGFDKDNFRKTSSIYGAISHLLSLLESFGRHIFQGFRDLHVNLFLDRTCYLEVAAGHIYVKQQTP